MPLGPTDCGPTERAEPVVREPPKLPPGARKVLAAHEAVLFSCSIREGVAATCGEDEVCLLWDVSTGDVLRTLAAHKALVQAGARAGISLRGIVVDFASRPKAGGCPSTLVEASSSKLADFASWPKAEGCLSTLVEASPSKLAES